MEQNLQNRVEQLEQQIHQLEEENKALKAQSKKENKNNSQAILEKLKETEERYILSQSLAHIGSWEMEKGSEKLWASNDMLALLGLESGSNHLTLKQLLAMVHGDDRVRFESAFLDLQEKNKNFNIEIRISIPVKDEKEIRFVQMAGVVLKNENELPFKCLGIVKDITEFKKVIRDLTRGKEKAEESDKLKTSFLANMSHDLRTPMNAIIGYSELLNLSNTNPQSRREYSKIIKNKGLQLLSLIDDIIEVSKFETGTQEINKIEFNLNELLVEIKNIHEDAKIELGKENIQLILDMPDKAVNDIIYTDSGRLQQVIGNLINNGLKFTEKGSVTFGYQFEGENKLKFFVKDTGKGLSKDKQRYIFNRFKNIEKTTRLKYSGSGLGLTLSKRIIDMLGGKIWVESDENQGASFYFTLTLEKPEIEEFKEIMPESAEPSGQNWKDKVILIVEDEEINYKFLETVLHDTQAQVLYAKDGMQAIDLCISINKIDMILMDIKMPEMDGYEAAKRIKQIRPEIPIIAQTAFASREDKLNSLRSGCDDYVAKPIEIELLISKINKFFIEKDY
jgi:signal transduction histidine kinase/CheY-like chemotaxis protein